MRLAIDFDGTIVENDYPNIGKPIKEAAFYIRKLYYMDEHDIIINTCRAQEFEAEAKAYLILHNIPFHYINCNLPKDIEKYGMDCRKISADIYIDDKQIGGLPSWRKIYEYIQRQSK